MMPVLYKIREESAKALHKLLKESGETDTYSMVKHKSMLYQLNNAISLAEKELPLATKRELKSESKRVGKISLSKLQDMVEAGEKRFRGIVTDLRLPMAKILLSAEQSVAHRHATSAERYSGAVGARIRRDLAIGAVRGESITQTAKRLLRGDYLATKGNPTKMADKIAEKQFFRNLSDAERLVQTEQNNVHNVTQKEALEEANGDDPGWMKRWDATIDRRTCDECAWVDGDIVPVHMPFKNGYMYPPIHPRDRCGITPWRQEWPRNFSLRNPRVLQTRLLAKVDSSPRVADVFQLDHMTRRLEAEVAAGIRFQRR
jgi:SPP1 gp7 family putative phage head morphogenesis protein